MRSWIDLGTHVPLPALFVIRECTMTNEQHRQSHALLCKLPGQVISSSAMEFSVFAQPSSGKGIEAVGAMESWRI